MSPLADTAALFARKLVTVAAPIALAFAFAAQAADIYQWTDDAGRVHLADSVPPRYKAGAIRIDSRQFELSPEQQREAEARAAAAKKKALAAQRQQRASDAQATVSRPVPVRRAAPLAASPSGPDCEALQREYRESLECFAPFVNANGTVKPNAFLACKSVVNPTLKCGSPKAY